MQQPVAQLAPFAVRGTVEDVYEVIVDAVWEQLEAEFGLPSLEQVQARLDFHLADSEPVTRRLVRVFIRDGTYCPGFQFLPDGSLHPVVLRLFDRALALTIPHNTFAAWMVTPLARNGIRPVDALHRPAPLAAELDAFARRAVPPPPRR